VTGHGAEREEWIKSNRGPDREQWRMEKKQKHAPGKTEGLKNSNQELDSETQRKTKKTNERKPVMGYKMGWGKQKTAPGSWTQRDGDRQTNSVELQGAEGRIKR